MKRMMWMAAAALVWTAPLAAGADPNHATGHQRARQVASEHAKGPWEKPAGSAPAAVPEPSSLLLFATGTLLARAAVKRRGAGTP